MKSDELKAINATPHPKMKNACDGAIEVYPKAEVDEAIKELKAKLDEYVLVKLSTQQMLQILLDCGLIKEWYFNGKFYFVLGTDDPHLQIKELKAKLEDAGMRERRLRRALWLARAEKAKEMRRRLLIQGFDPKWEEVERKCRAKAKELEEM